MGHFLSSLHGRHDWHGSTLKRWTRALKYMARSASMARLHSAWLRYLGDSTRMAALVKRDPRLYERPLHNYINRRLSPARRFAIIESHYRHVLGQWPIELIDRVHAEGQASLGRLTLKDGSHACLEFCLPTGRGREGELALYLRDTDGHALSSIIFTLADAGHTLLIGCLQGAAAGLGREAVREFTRQAHGLRPKNLLLSMLYALAEVNHSTLICGVSNQAHPFASQPTKIKADYDGFWQECGGTLGKDGFYVLPAHEPRRLEAEVESKHRSAFRKREALRQQACHLLQDAIDPYRTVASEAA